MNKTEQLLTIIEKCLDILEQEKWNVEIESIEINPKLDEDDTEEEREEVTENVKDYSPKSLKEENEHLKNLIDQICYTFWFEKYITDSWALWVAWDKWLLEEIAKARKIINK